VRQKDEERGEILLPLNMQFEDKVCEINNSREHALAVRDKKWDYRTLGNEWQIYVPKGLWHVAMVKSEWIAQLIVDQMNEVRHLK